MLDVLILAIALSMDAFAVSVGLGAKQKHQLAKTSWLCAIYFGLSQGLMPLIGFFAGREVLGFVDNYTHWIAAGLLFFIGAKMIKEANEDEQAEKIHHLSHRVMFVLAIATSIDALASGFALMVFELNIWIACTVIAFITAIFSVAGVYLGSHSGTWLESKAEWLGGLVLIGLGCKILLF